MPDIPAIALRPGTSDHEEVYQRLRAAIMTGFFAPDTTLTLRGLSDALGCSQTPVREAVRRLRFCQTRPWHPTVAPPVVVAEMAVE